MGNNPGQFAVPRNEDWISRELQSLRQELNQLRAANPFTTMGITPQPGGIDVNGFINSLRADGTVSLAMDDDGAFIVFNGAGEEVARFGELVNSNPGQYGVEILYSGAWVQVGAGNVDWGNISNVPATFTPSGHTHPGGDVTGRVAEAQAADGVTPEAYARDVGGMIGTRLAVYMHESGLMGYNTSSQRYKKNVRDFALTEAQVLAFRFVKYDRKATGADDYTPAVSVDEPGFLAEEIAAVAPELAVIVDGIPETVRYVMFGPALVPVVQKLIRDRDAQRLENEAMKQAIRDLGGTI